MSAGGIFKLIANDGKADKMIMASDFLTSRIKDITCKKTAQGYADPTPSLLDIERTHILYVNAHYKPFAAISYEYQMTRPNTGTPMYGGNVQFSIPQFGDFFSDMVVNVSLDQTSAVGGTIPAFPAFVGASDQVLTATSSVSALQNTTAGVYTTYTHQYVDFAGNVLTVGAAASDYVRYAEYPGEALFTDVKFEVNGNPLDEYIPEAVVFHRKFKIPPNKILGWKRLVGQETPVEAYTDICAISGFSNYPASMVNLTDIDGNVVPGSPSTPTITARQQVQIVSGPQTPQATQPVLDIWNPLIFWFNMDTRLAVPSVSIPYGQRFITIDIADQDQILFTAPGNVYLQFTVEATTSAGVGKGTAAALAVVSTQQWITLTPVLCGSTVDSTQRILNMNLYINNIFLLPEIHDIYIKRIGFTLIRLYKYQIQRETIATDQVLLSQLKYPVESMFVGMRPVVNIDPNNPNTYRDWHRMTQIVDNVIEGAANASSDFITDDTVAWNAANIAHKTTTSMIQNQRIVVPTPVTTVDTLELKVHGIDIYQQFDQQFFRDYLPYTFGGANIVSSEDPGAYMINFAFYPGTYQPSGHMNVSRAREFYLIFTSSYVAAATPADLIVIASAINFLLISDGSAVLRYTT